MKFELLPNEIFIQCFQYLNAADIFYSFDQLNYRFYRLIQNISLHLNFQQLKKSRFNQCCQILLSNPEIKYKIISLKLSNNDTHGQIHEFLSLFRLNEFINLQSLSLIYVTDKNVEQLKSMLPLLSNLYYFSYYDWKHQDSQILSMLPKSKLRILSIPIIDSNSESIFNEITSLKISHCYLENLYELFKYLSMLKYLKIEHLVDQMYMNNLSKLPNEKALYLKEFIVNNSMQNFKDIKILLKRIPNLTIFTIKAADEITMIDADRWQQRPKRVKKIQLDSTRLD
jgi:hypothetical protein